MTTATAPAWTTAALSDLDRADFVAVLGDVFEHSPWVAERAWDARPFADRTALCAALVAAMHLASPDEQLALILAHPELAGRAAARGELTSASAQEQRGAGLESCSPQELAALTRLNADYRQRFGFPFILAVRGLARDEIIAALTARLGNTPEAEFAAALAQIARIAELRLAERVA